MTMKLDLPIEFLPATSIVTIERLKSLGIKTYEDLLNFFPSRHEDFSIVSPISTIQEGEKITVKGKVVTVKNNYVRRSFSIQRVTISDGSGMITAVWYNQPFLIRTFKPEMYVSISGNIAKFKKLELRVREYEVLKSETQETIHTARIIPVYSTIRGLSSRTIREKIFFVLQFLKQEQIQYPELLPEGIKKKFNLSNEHQAYENIHFPHSKEVLTQAKDRLAFDELFVIQLSSKLVRQHWEREKVGHMFNVKENNNKIQKFIANLPFSLTHGQQKVISDVLNDLAKKRPMNRFLQGDVGAGKTVIAALAAYVSYLNGFQTLFMAPTEILAIQHYNTIYSLFNNTSVNVGLQTSSKKLKRDADIIVGTHALLTKKASFDNVGLVVVDEQHRFGVRQRALLKEKGLNPHLLTMTATPIPRTVALTIYGDLDISYLDEMPKGRIPVKTFLVPNNKRADGYQWVLRKVKEENAQVFVVCPLIEESEIETMKSVKAATKEYEYLKTNVFPKLRVGLIHGKLKPKEKDSIMEGFQKKELDILVATSVVEVGVDIPGATVMIIEGADRYGLAQLHQLRGRVGRSNKQSFCFVFTESNDPQVFERLSYFSKHTSGQKLAEYDLERRGPGDPYGVRQHGFDTLQIASLTDYKRIEDTKNAVELFLKNYSLGDFPTLRDRIESFQVHQIAQD